MGMEKRLTKAELKHLRKHTKSKTLEQFKTARRRRERFLARGAKEICLNCHSIAVKLGIST